MGKGSGKRAMQKRVEDVSADVRDDTEQLKRATKRRIATLGKDLVAARRIEERRRSRLAAASAEADRILGEITKLVRHASEPAFDGARKVGHAAGGLVEGAADAVADAAGGVVHAAESAVHVARRAVRAKPAVAEAPVRAKPAAGRSRRARPATPPPTGPDNG